MVDPIQGTPPEAIHLATAALGAAQTRELRRAKEKEREQRVQSFAQEFKRALEVKDSEVDPGGEASASRQYRSEDDSAIETEHETELWRQYQKANAAQVRRNHPRAPKETPDHSINDDRADVSSSPPNWLNLFA